MPVAAAVELSDQDFLVFTQSGPVSEVRLHDGERPELLQRRHPQELGECRLWGRDETFQK
jgi:hypothetical protein